MKELSLKKMESIEGGRWKWSVSCGWAVAGFATVFVGAIFAPPVGIALAATIISSGITFGGSTYAINGGACSH